MRLRLVSIATTTLLAGVCAALMAGPVGAMPPLPPPEGLVISEIMYNPAPDLEFPQGQWFEVYNSSDEVLSLAGVTIEIETQDVPNIPPRQAYVLNLPEAPSVQAHSFLVLGASKAQALNGGVPVDYAYGSWLTLPKQGGILRLTFLGEVLDEVAFGPLYGLAVGPGVSLSLEPGGMTPQGNDAAEVWCASEKGFDDALFPMLATPGAVGNFCDSDHDGFTEGTGDCDDADAAVSPGVGELCNGKDDDCDSLIDEEPLTDAPQWPSVGVCAAGGPVCLGALKWSLDPPPDFEENEVSCDGLDNDCDGETDEGLLNRCGLCGPLAPEVCNGEDDDCDGETDEGAAPPDDFTCPGESTGVCKETQVTCAGQQGWVCIRPPEFEEEEVTCDGLDNDCDGETDENFGVGEPCVVGEGLCRSAGVMVCTSDGQGVECEATQGASSIEICGDNIDNDCDGETDEGFHIGESCEVGVGACRVTGKYFCSPDGLSEICSAEPLEPSLEECGNSIDDDCDGLTDEAGCLPPEKLPSSGCSTVTQNPTLTFLLLLSIALAAFYLLGRAAR